MSDINVLMLSGRLVRDPELRTGKSGIPVATFSLAANHRFKGKSGEWQEECAFVPCVAFLRLAEQIGTKRKGEPIFVSGRLRTEKWEKNGTNHSRLVLLVNSMHFIQSAASESTKQEDEDSPPTEATGSTESDDLPF